MGIEAVRAWLDSHAPDLPLIETEASSATVELAAEALGVEPGGIAKTLAIRVREEVVLVVARGDARLDNGKAKAEFGGRPRMLNVEETFALTGHRWAASAHSGCGRRFPSFATFRCAPSTSSTRQRVHSTARSG